MTTHYDIIPTLMQSVLGCRNAPEDYSIGHDLLNPVSRLPFIVGSYINFGIRQKDRITLLYSKGEVINQNLHAKSINVPIRKAVVEKALK